MTPRALRQALAARRPTWPNDPLDLLAAVEAVADQHPGDPGWTALLLTANLLATAPTVLPAGLLRDELVRFDGLSATWSARDPEGARFLVRVPRPHLSAVERRLLERDARSLEGLVEGLQVREGSLVAPLVGQAVVGPVPESTTIRFVTTTLTALERWRVRGFGPLTPGEEELREVEGRARIVCLTPGPLKLDSWLRHLAFTLRPRGLMAPVLRGLVELPPSSPAEAGERLIRAFRDDLATRSLELHRAQLLAGHSRRRARLTHAITRLQRAVPPPTGESPVGYDLEARPTFVRCDGETIVWGPVDQLATVWDGVGFDAPGARRLLRALATSPSAGAGYPDHVGRWVSSGLRLRTLRLLLEKTG